MSVDAASVRAAVATGRASGSALPPLRVDGRVAALQQRIAMMSEEPADRGVDALLVTDLLNVRHLTGFTGSAARLVVTPTRAVLVTDGRYAERAVEEADAVGFGGEVEVRRSPTEQDELLATILRGARRTDAMGAVRVGLEAPNVSWQAVRAYERLLPDGRLLPTEGIVESLRRTKDEAELARLARASAVADAAFAEVLPMLAEQPTERAFALALVDAMVRRGAEGESFPSIIASGPNASRPHHHTGGRTIVRGDQVICDFGARVDGYHSDTTRTVHVGEPSAAQQRHHDVVRAAHGAGVALVATGVSGQAVDAACRAVIAEAGWADHFVHGTGHGSGLQIHEQPWLGPTSTSTLAAGDICTVEPGVYLPGQGGVRVEDSMVVTDEGPVLLTASPYDLVVG